MYTSTGQVEGSLCRELGVPQDEAACFPPCSFDDSPGFTDKVTLSGYSGVHLNVRALLKNRLDLKEVIVFGKIWPHFMLMAFIRGSS